MRIITGKARGRRLITLEGNDVRPTTDRVKEGIFSAIQFDIEGRKVLDLFAGSGQLGLEALSRGAAKAAFVDSSSKSLRVINQNIETCGFSDCSRVYAGDALSFLSRNSDVYDIVFLDPPYDTNLIERVLDILPGHLSKFAVIICETDIKKELPENVGELEIYKRYRYGKTAVTMYKRPI